MAQFEIDCVFLLMTFFTSFVASVVATLILLKFQQTTNHNDHNDTMTTNTPMSLSIRPDKMLTPIKPNGKKVHLMDGEWKEDTFYSIYMLPPQPMKVKYDDHFLPFTPLTHTNNMSWNKQHHACELLLTKCIPSLNRDIIQIITHYVCALNLYLSKYVLLDCIHKNIHFFIHDMGANQLGKTRTMNINTSTVFAKQILDKIDRNYISNASTRRCVECSIYFHNNHVAIVSGQYFVLSLVESMDPLVDLHCNILCKFGENADIMFIHQIIYDIKDVKFDGKYIYAANANVFSVKIYHLEHVQNKVSVYASTITHIKYYQIYDKYMLSSLKHRGNFSYLLVSEESCSRLHLYRIDSKHVMQLHHEFELKHIFQKYNHDYYTLYVHEIDENMLEMDDIKNETVLAFEMNDKDILFCVCYNSVCDRTVALNVHLSMFGEARLINYVVLDGLINMKVKYNSLRAIYPPFKCLGIEPIYTHEGKDWLVFLKSVTALNEIEFRIDALNLNIKYGKRKAIWRGYNYSGSCVRKQIAASHFM